MGLKDVAEVLTAVMWPLTAAAMLIIFRRPLVRLSESVAIKTIKLKAFNIEIELTKDEAERTLDELLKDILDSTTNGLTQSERDLFNAVRNARGQMTVKDILPGFERKDENDGLKTLRSLRDRKLIRPREGRQWLPEKHPVVTHFGELICKIEPKLPRQGQLSQ